MNTTVTDAPQGPSLIGNISDEEKQTARRNELAMRVDAIVQECTEFNPDHPKFRDWMEENWELVDELRGLFPPRGSHAKVGVLGTDHTWESFCEAYFGRSRKYVNDLLESFREADRVQREAEAEEPEREAINAEREEAAKRSEAAKKANETRNAKKQAREADAVKQAMSEHAASHRDAPVEGCAYCPQKLYNAESVPFVVDGPGEEAEGAEETDNRRPERPDHEAFPEGSARCCESCEGIAEENEDQREFIAELQRKLEASQAYAAGNAVVLNDDTVFGYLKKEAGIVNGNAPTAEQVRYLTAKFVGYLKKLGWTDIDKSDQTFTIINH